MGTTNALRITGLVLEADEPEATGDFISRAFGLDEIITTRAASGPSRGFRGYSLSLVYPRPADVDAAAQDAVEAGAETIKPVAKSFWGYGGSLRAPDGTVWTLASESKKDAGPATGARPQLVVLAGVDDVRASRTCYEEKGMAVARGFGAKYVEFDSGPTVTFALQSRRAVAKNAGVDAEGEGARRLAMTVEAGGGFTDPDGYAWV